jgi:DNA polymerase elongation subunit (family B)
MINYLFKIINMSTNSDNYSVSKIKKSNNISVKTEPIKSEQDKTEPIKSEQDKTEPIKTEPIKSVQFAETVENNDFIFNVLDWHDFDEVQLSNDSESLTDSESDKKYSDIDKKYVIKTFGRTQNGESVYLKIENFPPHFYILLPESWQDNLEAKCDHLVRVIRSKNSSFEVTLEKYEVVKRKKLYGFCANKKFNFLRLVFTNRKAMSDAVRMFDNKIAMFSSSNNRLSIKERFIKFDVYESNIDPYVRFMHIQNILSCGWMKIDKTKLRKNSEPCICNHAYAVDWFDVQPANITQLAPFKICSFDLECKSGDGTFPQATRIDDKIIQIGMTFNNYGNSEITKRIMISLGTCDQINGTEVYECETEQDLFMKFQQIIRREDPDVLTGYNIFGFDYPYLMERAKFLKVDQGFYYLSKLKNYKCKLIKKELSSSGLGDNKMFYVDTIGISNIDLMKVVQRDFKLNSYKLDSVAENFFKDKVDEVSFIKEISEENLYKIKAKGIQILKAGNYVRFEKDGEVIMSKYKIHDIDYNAGYFTVQNLDQQFLSKCKLFWGMVKDDIKPKDIFELYGKTSADRKLIAEYCIQDCALVSKLMDKLQIMTNNISMASVCHVPLHYIFFRGQGIKSLSLVARFCRLEGYLIPTLKKDPELDTSSVGYEGATVFEPEIGFHRKPIPVMDYNSLYPSSIISKNVSPETLVTSPEYDNLPGYIYYDVHYNNHDGSQTHCRYAKKVDEFLETNPAKSKFGIIPTILMGLLSERKAAKKEMDAASDAFTKTIFDGKQNALKVTANSIYGQLGAPTSPIYFKHGAACTTAIGRDMLCLGKAFVENELKDILLSLYKAISESDDAEYENIMKTYLKERDPKFEKYLRTFLPDLFTKYDFKPKVIYGDTDSIFIKMDIIDAHTKEDLYDKSTLFYNIELGKCASKFLKTKLPYPHNMEYEKTFYPYAQMAKKKYIGNKYVEDPDSFKQTSMGVVLKRRDNANIVKKIVGGMVNIMMNEIDIDKTIRFIKKAIGDLLKGKFQIHEFITSKTLKGSYVDRTKLAHVVLADRMACRDPGNAPQLNDRIPFVAIEVQEKKGQKMLQGDKIEHPEYILENNLKIDYLFYLTNQIMNPSIQFLELIMKPVDAEKLFRDFIILEEDRRKGRQSLSKFGIKKVSKPVAISDTDEFDFDNLINKSAKPNPNAKSKKSTLLNIQQKNTESDSDEDLNKFYEQSNDIEILESDDENDNDNHNINNKSA